MLHVFVLMFFSFQDLDFKKVRLLKSKMDIEWYWHVMASAWPTYYCLWADEWTATTAIPHISQLSLQRATCQTYSRLDSRCWCCMSVAMDPRLFESELLKLKRIETNRDLHTFDNKYIYNHFMLRTTELNNLQGSCNFPRCPSCSKLTWTRQPFFEAGTDTLLPRSAAAAAASLS